MPFPLAGALEDATNQPGVDAPDDNPEETQGGKTKAVTYGPDNQDLPKELQDAGLALLLEAQKEDLYQRRIEVLRARRNRFYERGIQHIYEDQQGFFIQGSAGATVPNPSNPNEDIQCGQYLNNYNIFGRALRIIVAKLTENPIGVDFEPDSGDESKDLQASTAAEGYRVNFDRRNDPKDVLTAIVRNMGNDGRTVQWTRTETDVARWGVDEQGQPRRVQTTDTFGVLETKCPIIAKSLGDCPYFIITDDPHVFSAKMQYPYFRKEISTYGESGIADDEFERIARIGVLQGASASYQITDTYQYYCERKRPWFRPAMFESDALDGDFNGGSLRDAFRAAFPDGAQFAFIGEQYVGSRNTCMDDDLAVDFPYPGEGMSREGYMDPAVPLQDDFNDDMNNYHEVRVVGWPSTWVRASTAELAAINDQIAAPMCFRALPQKPSAEAAMEDSFYREPDPNIPASFMEATEWMITYLLQFILAIPSAVQGAGMKDQKTASGYQNALIQAMGQLGLIWGAVQRLMSRVYAQAALAASREPQDGKPLLVIPNKKGQPIVVQMADLGKGHFLCHPSSDAGYPEGTMAKRGTLSQILQLAMQDPAVAQQIMQSPDNWDFIFSTYGIPELVIPEARVRRKQLAEIEILLKQQPLPPSPEELQAAQVQHAHDVMMATAQGAPPPSRFDPNSLLHSSIQPDPLDYHPWELEECREFLSDWPKVQQQMAMQPCTLCGGKGMDADGAVCPDCQGEGETNNAAGIQNVRLHANEHLKFIQKMAAQQAAMQQAAAQPAPIKPKPGAPAPQQEQQAA